MFMLKCWKVYSFVDDGRGGPPLRPGKDALFSFHSVKRTKLAAMQSLRR
jgi:hypothetical protein